MLKMHDFQFVANEKENGHKVAGESSGEGTLINKVPPPHCTSIIAFQACIGQRLKPFCLAGVESTGDKLETQTIVT